MASHLDYFRRFSALSTEEAQAIIDSTVLHTLAKGDHLRREGETSPQTYFVQKGCVRQYRLVEGEEITTHFYTEGQWIMGPMSFGKPIPATDYLICMEPTEVVVGDEEKAQALFDLFPRFEAISRGVMETVIQEQQQAMALYHTSTPEQRYQHLLDTRPDLPQRVPQYQLASYLGIKPESLSRIRKRLSRS